MNLKSLATLLLFTFPILLTAQDMEAESSPQPKPMMEPKPHEAPVTEEAAYQGDERLREIENSDYELYQFEVVEETAEMSAGVAEALVLFIPDGARSDVEKEWKGYLKPFGSKVKTSRGEMVSMGTEISDLSNKSVDIFTTVEKQDRGVNLVSIFYINNDVVSFEDHPKVFEQSVRFLKEFGHEYHKHVVEDELKGEEKAMKKLQSSGEKLVKENDNLHKDIEKYKRLIKEAEADIITNIENQEINSEDQRVKAIDLEVVRWKLKAY